MKNSKTSRILTGSSSQSWVNGAGLDSNGLRPVLPPRTLRLFVWCINIGCNWQGAGIHYRWEHTTRRNYLHTQVTQSIYLFIVYFIAKIKPIKQLFPNTCNGIFNLWACYSGIIIFYIQCILYIYLLCFGYNRTS